MKVNELMERKQEFFRDCLWHANLLLKLKHNIAEDEFVELLEDNMNYQMGGWLLTSLAEHKKEGIRVDRWLKNHWKSMRSWPVSEIQHSVFTMGSWWNNSSANLETAVSLSELLGCKILLHDMICRVLLLCGFLPPAPKIKTQECPDSTR